MTLTDQITDPGPFLSTIAECSATLVAIVGGLLVARFVTLTSEREGVQKLIEEAKGRLATAKNRERHAHRRLLSSDVNEFFDFGVLTDVQKGKRDLAELRLMHRYTPLTDDEMAEALTSIVEEFGRAHSTLTPLVSGDDSGRPPEWEEFKLLHPQLPTTNWDEVWDIEYGRLVRPPKEVQQSSFLGMSVPFLPSLPTPPEYVKLEAERRDAMVAELERAKTHAQDIEEGIVHLERRREAVGRPRGLTLGLTVLGYFTIVGVGLPLFIMSGAPQDLSPAIGGSVFWLFVSGLVLLLGYMTVLAVRLSGWREKREASETTGRVQS